MNRSVFASAIAVAIGLSACDGRLTTEDGDDMAHLEESIIQSPQELLASFKVFAANRWAIDWLGSKDPNDVIGTMVCTDNRGKVTRDAITVANVLRCLAAEELSTYEDCVSLNVRMASLNQMRCDWEPGAAEYNKDAPPLTNPDNQRAEVIARFLIQAVTPPAWLLPYIVGAGAAGALIAGPAAPFLAPLCALSYGDSWACPDDPAYPGVPQHGGSPPSGERQ